MTDNRDNNSLHNLKIPLWLIAIALMGDFSLNAYSILFPGKFYERYFDAAYEANAIPVEPEPTKAEIVESEKLANFHELTPEEQISLASVIVITKYEEHEGYLRSIAEEIINREDVTFRYSVGDEFAQNRRRIEPNTDYGDGEVMFFIGESPNFKYSTSHSHDRLRGMGDLPITELRILATKKGTL